MNILLKSSCVVGCYLNIICGNINCLNNLDYLNESLEIGILGI